MQVLYEPTIARATLLATLRRIYQEGCRCRQEARKLDPDCRTACGYRAEADGMDYALSELAGRFGFTWEEIEEE